MLKDLRQALRALKHNPGFSIVTGLTLALGIGVTTTMFSVVDAVLLEPLAYDDPADVMTVWESNPGIGIRQEQVSAGTFVDWRTRTRRFTDLAAYQNDGYVLTGQAEPAQLSGTTVTPSLFTILGVPPVLGRTFTETEGERGGGLVTVLSHRFWQRQFGGDPSVLGQVLTLDAQPYTVVGVMPATFQFPPDQDVDLWIPLNIPAQLIPVRGMRVYNVIGRLASNVDPTMAQAELAALADEIAAGHPQTNRGWTAAVTPALDQVLGDSQTLLLVLSGAAAFVLLIGCVNIASLLLARAMRQQGEYAIRATLGAGPLQLLRRSVAESVVLVVAGGTAGLLSAIWGVSVLRAALPADVPRVSNIAIDGTVLLFAVGVSGLAGVVFGLGPALQVVRPRLADMLQASATGGVGGRHRRQMLGALVSVQVALALMLLVSATGLVRSLDRLLDVDPGFRTDDVVSVALELPETLYGTRERQQQFYNELVDGVAALPGVTHAGAVSALPMSTLGTEFDLPFEIPGRDAPTPGERPRAEYRAVIPGYFTTLGIPLRRGRLLDRFDRNEGRPVMVINESMERTFFSDVDAIGQSLGVPMAGSIEIVGVVGDVKHSGLGEDARPEMFVSYQNFPVREMHVVARTDPGSTGATIRAIHDVVRSRDPQLPIAGSATVAELVSSSLTGTRFNTIVLAIFSACALLLAAVGIYGVMSYAVEQRTGEIGMRMALGAGPGETMRLVLRHAATFVATGSVVGVAGVWLMGRWIQGMLYEVSAVSAPAVGAGLVFLIGVALLAAGVPTRRAMRVDPVTALRVK